MESEDIFRGAFLTFALVMMMLITWVSVVYVFSPEAVGHWQARKEIAFESVWQEYAADCDCMENLE